MPVIPEQRSARARRLTRLRQTVKVEVSEYPNVAFPPFSKWEKRETGENRLLHRARNDVPFVLPIGVAKSCTAETRIVRPTMMVFVKTRW